MNHLRWHPWLLRNPSCCGVIRGSWASETNVEKWVWEASCDLAAEPVTMYTCMSDFIPHCSSFSVISHRSPPHHAPPQPFISVSNFWLILLWRIHKWKKKLPKVESVISYKHVKTIKNFEQILQVEKEFRKFPWTVNPHPIWGNYCTFKY